MQYINRKTGCVIESISEVKGENWEPVVVPAPAPKKRKSSQKKETK